MSVARSTRSFAVAVAALAALGTLTPAQAATDRGLYGSQDPTYDGVYRQGLALTGLAANDLRVPGRAVSWLTKQQCADGSFVSYRARVSAACPAPDPAAYSGPDSNSTAMAAMALRAAGENQAARAAVRYLRGIQNRDGGFPYYAGGTSDANSTGLTLAALKGARTTGTLKKQQRSAARYLRSVQLRCSAAPAERGLMSYQRSPLAANPFASAQAALGLVTTLPMTPDSITPRRLRCAEGRLTRPVSAAEAVLATLRRGLRDGLLPSAFGTDGDPSATAQALIAARAAGIRGKELRPALRALKRAAGTYAVSGGVTDAGATGTLLLTAAATGGDPRSFGGTDLVSLLRASRR